MKQLALAALLLAGTASAQTAPAPAPAAATSPTAAEDARLMAALDAAFDESLARSPETQTSLGLKTNYARLDDYTDAGAEADQALAERQLAQLKRDFDPAKLGPAARMSLRLFEYNTQQGREQLKWRPLRYVITNQYSIAGSVPVFLINEHRIESAADAEAYVARLTETERVMKEVVDRFDAQVARGVLPPKLIFEPVLGDARRILTGAPFEGTTDNTVRADFRKKVGALKIADADKQRLYAAADAALTGPFKRGYDRLIAALTAAAPKATADDGVWKLPDGDAYYSASLGLQTTTPITGDQVHETGLAEVKRIQAEMAEIQRKVGFQGTLQQFFAELKTNPKYQYPNDQSGKDAYLKDADAFVAQVMGVSGRWFNQLPKAKLEVRAVEPFREATSPIAFYNMPAPDGSRPGIYYVNLSDMRQVLKPQIEAISYHEGAPGHHFQIALAQELGALPKFRRFGNYGAYAEGWGLYAERLGKEMGFYQDPISDFGRLSTELWRAVRLVLDSGLHHKRWSRDQAIAYFRENSLLSERDVVKEVDRFLVWPGQAASYKIGQLKILELRARAEQALGSRFDIKAFHDVVLANGALPLDVLEEQVDAYIAANKS